MPQNLRRYIRGQILEVRGKKSTPKGDFSLKYEMGKELKCPHNMSKAPKEWKQFLIQGVMKIRGEETYYKFTVDGKTFEGQIDYPALTGTNLDDIGPFANAMFSEHRGIPQWFREPQIWYNVWAKNFRIFLV